MKSPFIFLVLLTLSACASHGITPPTPSATVTQEPFAYHLAGAPIAGSPEDQKDYETLLSLQKTRTTEECARGVSEVKISLGSLYGPPYGPLSAKEVASLTQLFQVLSKGAWPMIGQAKDHWKRPRPFITHTDLKPCAKLEPSSSYPSGHSAISHFYMHILIDMFPDRKDAIEKRAEQIAYDRNIVGVHYPSDIRDGKILGDQIYEYFAKDKKFKELIETYQASTSRAQ
jgi:acid phosphatase (class A)